MGSEEREADRGGASQSATRQTPAWGALLLTLLCSVVPSAWPWTPEVAAQEPTPIDGLSARRDPGEVDVQGCLSDLTRDPDRRPVEPHVIPASTEVLVDGQRVALVDDAVWWARPKFDPQDTCPHSVFVVYSITLEELASVGVTEPTPGTWRPIQIDLRVDAGGTTYTGRIDISIGSGPRVGAITSATNTSEGMRLRGWVVDPVRYGSLAMIATVNGTILGRNNQPKGPTESPRAFSAALPSSDVWNDLSLIHI